MNSDKQKFLEDAGYVFMDADEFLGLTEEEKAEVDKQTSESKFYVLREDVTVPDPDGHMWSPPNKPGAPVKLSKGTFFELFRGNLLIWDGPGLNDEQKAVVVDLLEPAEPKIGQWIGGHRDELIAALGELGLVSEEQVRVARAYIEELEKEDDQFAVQRMMYRNWVAYHSS